MEFKLSDQDLLDTRRDVHDMRYIMNLLDVVRSFKLGDYIIVVRISNDTQQRVPAKNSYGAIIKYQVVFVDELGLPHVKLINNNGKPSGRIQALLTTYSRFQWGAVGYDDYDFQLDPDYADSIILQSESEYDPMERHNALKSARQEITDHNKRIKLPTSTIQEVVETFSKLEVGITYWTSPKRGFTVLENTHYVLNKKTTYVNGLKVSYAPNHTVINKIKVRHSNGKIKTYEPADMKKKNIYAGIPKSYNDKSDSI
jgi:hypothetical protein